MAESEEELKSLLMKVKEESEKVVLKLSIQKTKIMASGPSTSWQIDGETMETVTDFILGGSKITADGDCSHEIRRHLLLGRKVMTNLLLLSRFSRVLLCATPLGSPVPGILQARTLEWVAISFSTGPITSWQIEEEKVKVVTDFLFLSSKITVDGDCSHEIRR